MAGIRQFIKRSSTVEDYGTLCEKIEKWNALSACIADFAITELSRHRWHYTDRYFTFQNWLPKQLKQLLTQRVLLVAITREQDLLVCMVPTIFMVGIFTLETRFFFCLPSFCAIQIKERFWIYKHWQLKVEESSRLGCWV